MDAELTKSGTGYRNERHIGGRMIEEIKEELERTKFYSPQSQRDKWLQWCVEKIADQQAAYKDFKDIILEKTKKTKSCVDY